jgi:hypothetical protein
LEASPVTVTYLRSPGCSPPSAAAGGDYSASNRGHSKAPIGGGMSILALVAATDRVSSRGRFATPSEGPAARQLCSGASGRSAWPGACQLVASARRRGYSPPSPSPLRRGVPGGRFPLLLADSPLRHGGRSPASPADRGISGRCPATLRRCGVMLKTCVVRPPEHRPWRLSRLSSRLHPWPVGYLGLRWRS